MLTGRGLTCFSRQAHAWLHSSRGLQARTESISEQTQPEPIVPKLQVTTNWRTLEDQPLTETSFRDLLSNNIPSIRHENFLSRDECQSLVNILESPKIGQYNPKIVFPRVGMVGITQFDYQNDKDTYFNGVADANVMQENFKKVAKIDVLGRVRDMLEKTTGLKTRIAQEGNLKYFAGLLRAVDNYIQIHPDYAPYDGPDWEIGHITAQLTWNVLLRQVPGGETIIYDRQWQGEADDVVFRKKFPRYAYAPSGVQGRIFKTLPAIEGHLTLFNPRNFHEVKPCDRAWDRPEELTRFTLSSFVGLLPGEGGSPPCLILWS